MTSHELFLSAVSPRKKPPFKRTPQRQGAGECGVGGLPRLRQERCGRSDSVAVEALSNGKHFTQWEFQDLKWRYLPYIRPIFQA